VSRASQRFKKSANSPTSCAAVRGFESLPCRIHPTTGLYYSARVAERGAQPWWKALGSAAAVGFGAYIALTSVVGIMLGVQAGDGWLAILYGALGVSMGLAGVVSAFVGRPFRSALLGWFLVGIATRAVVVGDLFFLIIGVPVAVVLLAALAVELSVRASATNTLWCLAGAASSVIAFAALAVAAPHLPVICASPPAAGTSISTISYPSDNSFPYDGIANQYFERCGKER
jgi:hypothetical protein